VLESEESEEPEESDEPEESEESEESDESEESEESDEVEESDELEESEGSARSADELDSELSDDEGPVGLPLLHAARLPNPARAAPPESRTRNSRRSERRGSSAAGGAAESLSSAVSIRFSSIVRLLPSWVIRGVARLERRRPSGR
jgi:hypothetical protein